MSRLFHVPPILKEALLGFAFCCLLGRCKDLAAVIALFLSLKLHLYLSHIEIFFFLKKNQTAGSYKEKVSNLILIQSKVEQENNLMSEAVSLSPGSAIYCFYKPGFLLWPSVASSLKWK